MQNTFKKKLLLFGLTVIVVIAVVPVVSLAYAQVGKVPIDPIEVFMAKAEYDNLAQGKKVEIDKEIQRLKDARSGKIKQAVKQRKLPAVDAETAAFDHGIMEKETPAGVRGLNVLNVWRGTIGQNNVSLYAGNNYDDATQGIVYVDVMDQKSKTILQKEVKTPSQAGAVKVIKENGDRITLQGTNGATFIFNVTSFTFE